MLDPLSSQVLGMVGDWFAEVCQQLDFVPLAWPTVFWCL
jgi:hypothetical protein